MADDDKFIGLLGLGYWGKNLLRNFHELGALRAACDSNPALLEKHGRMYPGAVYSSTFDSVLDDPEIRAVAIATPAATHYEMASKALQAGKDVLVEKPLSLTLKEGAGLVGLARKLGRIIMVGHILRYHPAILKLKELIDSGALGKVQYIYSNRLNIGKLRTEENIWWSFAPHDISVILFLVGIGPTSVTAFGGDYLSKGVTDITLTTLEFGSGVKGHIFVSWLNPFKEQKLVVVGSKAMAVFDDVSSEKLLLYPHQIDWEEGKIPVAKRADFTVVPFEWEEPLKAELRHFMECVKTGKRPVTDGEEGLRVLSILEAAERSLSGNGKTDCMAKEKAYFAHESAFIDSGAEIGEGTRIWHFSHVLSGTKIGKNCVIGQNVMIGPDVTVGEGCKLQNNVSLYKGVRLEDGVFCGPSSVFTNVYNPRAFIERKNEYRETLVRKGATVGANATIICGATIGEYALIGAGALVRGDVPAYAVYAGVPAKRIGWVCKCGTSLKHFDAGEDLAPKNRAVCPLCGSVYELEGEKLFPIEERI